MKALFAGDSVLEGGSASTRSGCGTWRNSLRCILLGDPMEILEKQVLTSCYLDNKLRDVIGGGAAIKP